MSSNRPLTASSHPAADTMQGHAVQSDDQLMGKIAQGDKSAFTEFTLRHVNKLLAFAMRYMNQRDDAEDITQEAFTRLWTKAPQWQNRGITPLSWLYRITYHLCIDSLRKRKPVATIDEDTRETITTEESASQQEIRQQAVEHALSALPERQRSAILMCTYQGLSNREASEALDISVDALESLLSRARRKLREQLMQQEAIEP